MPLYRFSLRFQRLALWLSLLALCAALMAPAAALAQEMRTGQWVGLCSGGAEPDGHVQGDSGHCTLCAWPGLAGAPGSSVSWLQSPAFVPVSALSLVRVVLAAQPPAIRGPPAVS